MVIVALLLKPIAWFVAFESAFLESRSRMLLWAAGITVLLTLVDMVSVAENLTRSAHLLTLVLYALMSFTLLPLAWKVRRGGFAAVLNVFGILGSFAGVNFTMDFIRTFMPVLNR